MLKVPIPTGDLLDKGACTYYKITLSSESGQGIFWHSWENIKIDRYFKNIYAATIILTN